MKAFFLLLLLSTSSLFAQAPTFVSLHNELVALYEIESSVHKLDVGALCWVFQKSNVAEKENMAKAIQDLKVQLSRLTTSDSAVASMHRRLRSSIQNQIMAADELAGLLTKFEDYEDGSILFMAQDVLESQYAPAKSTSHMLLRELIFRKKMEFTVLSR